MGTASEFRNSFTHMDKNISRDLNFVDLELKKDHETRPLYVVAKKGEDGRVIGANIFLETFSPIYQKAYDFIIAIAEPIARPRFIHEYEITQNSLYAAASIGLSVDDTLSALRRLSKNEIQPSLESYIAEKMWKIKNCFKR